MPDDTRAGGEGVELVPDGKVRFEDIVDLASVDALLESFTAMTGLEVRLRTHPEQVLVLGTEWHDAITALPRIDSEHKAGCGASDLALTSELRTPGQVAIRRGEQGQVDGATPIVVAGVHLATVFAGRVFFDATDRERGFSQPRGGYEEAPNIVELREVPVVSRARFEATLRFLGEFVTSQAAHGLENAKERASVEVLLKEKQFSEDALDSLPGLFYVFDTSGRFYRWNKNITERLGYTDEDMRSRLAFEFFAPEDRALAVTKIAAVFEHGTNEMENYLLSRSGEKILCHCTGRRMVVDDRVCLVGMAIDITKRQKAEQEKLRLESQLRQSQKLEAIGRLAGGIAHDFNNLLTGILGNIGLARMSLREGESVHENLNEMTRAANRAAELTHQLLAFSRKQVIEPKRIVLNQLIHDISKMLQRVIGEHVELEVRLEPNLEAIKADPGQVEQILLNLAINARDAMPQGGNIAIETANVVLDEVYVQTHPGVVPGEYVALIVNDTGVGMETAVREKIFEPFFTTKREGEGTGLGLSTVFGIVKQHGGNIEVYSEPGRGTTFKVFFPKCVEGQPPRKLTPAPMLTPTGTESILVVEDEEIVRTVAVEVLQSAGYKVCSAGSGPEALELVRGEEASIDLLLTDLVMPKMNGRQLASALSQKHPAIRILYTSGYTEDIIAHHGVLEVGLAFLGKPYTAVSLASKVREVLDGD